MFGSSDEAPVPVLNMGRVRMASNSRALVARNRQAKFRANRIGH